MSSTIIQFFHWYYPEDESLWLHFQSVCRDLARLGIDKVWFPPATKGASGTRSVGYDQYDLFDLGEFYQRGTVSNKYGTRNDYDNAIIKAHSCGIDVLADVVMNHKAGADSYELVMAHKVQESNRNKKVGKPREIWARTRFSFPGRGG